MKRYGVLYVDPPWRQSKGGKKAVRPKSSGEKLDYQVLGLDEIKNYLKLATELTENDAVLFLWTIDKYLFETQEIAEGLGWKLHARMVWNKVTGIPVAFTIRFGHEYLLYMYKGRLTKVAKKERGKIHSVFTERVRKHSQKPEVAYQIIERLYPNTKRLEMYARPVSPMFPKRKGWDVWGNEVESDIEFN